MTFACVLDLYVTMYTPEHIDSRLGSSACAQVLLPHVFGPAGLGRFEIVYGSVNWSDQRTTESSTYVELHVHINPKA